MHRPHMTDNSECARPDPIDRLVRFLGPALRNRAIVVQRIALALVVGVTVEATSLAVSPRVGEDDVAPPAAAKAPSTARDDGDAPKPIMVDAVAFDLAGGTRILGFLDRQHCGTTWIVNRGTSIPLLDRDVTGQTNVVVDSRDVELETETYRILQRASAMESANDWFVLGRGAEVLELYPEMKECFARVLELDPEFARKDLIARRLALVDAIEARGSQDPPSPPPADAPEAAEAADTKDAKSVPAKPDATKSEDAATDSSKPDAAKPGAAKPDAAKPDAAKPDAAKARASPATPVSPEAASWKQIQALHQQQDFKNARRWIVEYVAKWPRSEQRAALATKLEAVLAAQRKKQAKDVQTNFLSTAKQLCSQRAMDVSGGIESAKAWAREECFAEALRAVAKRTDLGGECEAFELWTDRYAYGSATPTCYGSGTFVLEYDAGNATVMSIPPGPDEWWKSPETKTADRASFLFSYFGEHALYDGRGGHIRVEGVSSKSCTACAGLGIIEYQNTHVRSGPSPSSTDCTRCKKLKGDRSINLR